MMMGMMTTKMKKTRLMAKVLALKVSLYSSSPIIIAMVFMKVEKLMLKSSGRRTMKMKVKPRSMGM